jgi:hypothetical protein
MLVYFARVVGKREAWEPDVALTYNNLLFTNAAKPHLRYYMEGMI